MNSQGLLIYGLCPLNLQLIEDMGGQLWKSDSQGNLVESGLRVSDMRATYEYQMTSDDGNYMAVVWTWPALP